MARTYEEDFQEANVFHDFLEQTCPPLLSSMLDEQGIPDHKVAKDLVLGTLVAFGKSRCQDARNAASRILKWGPSAGVQDVLSEGLSSMQMRLYCLQVVKGAREYQASHGQSCKDTALRKQHTDLKAFAAMTGSAIAAALTDSNVLKLIPSQPNSARSAPVSAVLPPAYQLHMEFLAVSHKSPLVRHAAGVMSLVGMVGMRAAEAERSRLVAAPLSASSDANTPVQIHCDAGKGPSRKEMYPFEAYTYPEGFLGDARVWLAAMFQLMRDRPCLMPKFKGPGKSSILTATQWCLEESLPASQWAAVYMDLLSEPPLCLTPAELKKTGWNINAPHSFTACIVRMFLGTDFNASDFFEAGRWACPEAVQSADAFSLMGPAVMPLRYTNGTPALTKVLSMRRRACRKVSDFVGTRAWHLVVPTREAQPFDFLLGPPPPVRDPPTPSRGTSARPSSSSPPSTSATSAQPPSSSSRTPAPATPARASPRTPVGEQAEDEVDSPKPTQTPRSTSRKRRRGRGQCWNPALLNPRTVPGGSSRRPHTLSKR
jgi:hypothetical protein